MTLTTSDGVRLAGAYLPGPPTAEVAVVLVHGFALSSRTPRIHAFAHQLATRVPVLVPDLRGHGGSGGLCALASQEAADVAAAVHAVPGDLPVVTVGISLGGAAVLLHAGDRHRWLAAGDRLAGADRLAAADRLAGVVAISAPAWSGTWDTAGTSRVRQLATSRLGRAALSSVAHTRLAQTCEPVPDSADLVAAISPAFTLVISDPADHYFGPEHAETLLRWAGPPRAAWLIPGGGHGTDLLSDDLAGRIVDYARAHLRRAAESAP
ncbi:MAG: alpha/beta hydrolase [Acidimicrobiales bacterium]